MNQGQEQTTITRYFDDSHVDWTDFDSILEYALLYWPETVKLSEERDEHGGRKGFTAWHHDDAVDGPYFDSGESKHIVRHMLWAILCGLPRCESAAFKVADIDRRKVREKFEDSVRSDVEERGDTDDQQLAYYRKHLLCPGS